MCPLSMTEQRLYTPWLKYTIFGQVKISEGTRSFQHYFNADVSLHKRIVFQKSFSILENYAFDLNYFCLPFKSVIIVDPLRFGQK